MVSVCRRMLGVSVALGLAAISLAGCTYSSAPASGFCVPRFTIEPSTAKPGDTVTLESTTVCDVDVPRDGWTVQVAPIGETALGVQSSVRDPFDGSWSVEVVLPADFPAGDAFAGIANWDYSDCNAPGDANSSGSCASASVDFVVTP